MLHHTGHLTAGARISSPVRCRLFIASGLMMLPSSSVFRGPSLGAGIHGSADRSTTTWDHRGARRKVEHPGPGVPYCGWT